MSASSASASSETRLSSDHKRLIFGFSTPFAVHEACPDRGDLAPDWEPHLRRDATRHDAGVTGTSSDATARAPEKARRSANSERVFFGTRAAMWRAMPKLGSVLTSWMIATTASGTIPVSPISP